MDSLFRIRRITNWKVGVRAKEILVRNVRGLEGELFLSYLRLSKQEAWISRDLCSGSSMSMSAFMDCSLSIFSPKHSSFLTVSSIIVSLSLYNTRTCFKCSKSSFIPSTLAWISFNMSGVSDSKLST
uniref:Uncharacterized protein n=1 Tax=Cacopsylla melanoneura TaxID=428564 RepID=A0A8D9AJW1_9HEMI